MKLLLYGLICLLAVSCADQSMGANKRQTGSDKNQDTVKKTAVPPTPTATAVPPTPTATPLPAFGDLLWSKHLHYRISARPVTDGDRIYVADHGGTLQCFSNKTGKKCWAYKSGDAFTAEPAMSEDKLFINGWSGNIHAVSKYDGELLWTFEADGKHWRGPLFHQSAVYVSGGSGYLRSLNPGDGSLNWSVRVTDHENGISTPVGGDGIIYVTSYDGYVYAIDSRTGEKLNSYRLGVGTLESLLIKDGYAYVPDWDGHLYAIDLASGRLVWNLWADDTVWMKPHEYQGNIYVGSLGGYFYSVDIISGKLNWVQDVGAPVRNVAIGLSEYVLVMPTNGKILALDTKTGSHIWEQSYTAAPSDDLNHPIMGDMNLSQNILTFGSDAGVIRAIYIDDSIEIDIHDIDESELKQYIPLTSEESREILSEILWNKLKVLGSVKTINHGDGKLETISVSYEEEVIKLFETAFYFLTGDPTPDSMVTKLYDQDDYVDITESAGSPWAENPAWCCIRKSNTLEMIVNAEYTFPSVLGAIAHESGHARQRIANPISRQDASMKEAVAFAVETAIGRLVGEYTGYEHAKVPSGYTVVGLFDHVWDKWSSNIEDLEEEHDRGYALLWVALYNDQNLSKYKAEMTSGHILSPGSLLEIADYFINMTTEESAEYLDTYLTKTKLLDLKSTIRSEIVRRNTTKSKDDNLAVHNWTLIIVP